ncbi:TPA: helix-turn-helix transcriptional regulator [Pluralibacter gergoviae]|uniref:helix-turn-helix transcriptional regulator n=1 Tax=Pluralibacter gergoviae TaxID=61647 RepID=UPI00192794C3|nr:helix-turn-helix transcriptional regulator [Pluralibacter gergoviae]HDS1149658.1 helix-turn-helix transcriptional regulator [Pluralibacter gergoviae]
MMLLETTYSTFPDMVISDLVQWIESDLTRAKSISAVARRSGYSYWHVQRLFKSITGYNLAGYIRARRMTVAAELILKGELNITSILVQVGFTDSSTFCKSFQRYFGISPSAFRNSSLDLTDRMIAPYC